MCSQPTKTARGNQLAEIDYTGDDFYIMAYGHCSEKFASLLKRHDELVKIGRVSAKPLTDRRACWEDWSLEKAKNVGAQYGYNYCFAVTSEDMIDQMLRSMRVYDRWTSLITYSLSTKQSSGFMFFTNEDDVRFVQALV